MSLPKRCRQWDIYRANLGEASDSWLMILASTQTNDIIETTTVTCEIVPEHVQKIAASPLNLPARSADTGLDWASTISVMTLACVPRSCLVSLEGRLEPMSLRAAALKGLNVLFGQEPWP